MIQAFLALWLCLSGIASGGQAVLAYSGGAKDLSGISWPAMSGDHFAVPAFAEGFSFDRSGMLKGIGDASGLRSLGYLRGRLESTNWTAGALRGYKVERGIDATGRGTGFTLKRDNVEIHSVSRGYTGVSDQVAGLSSGALMVLPQRDAQGRLTGYQWGNASGTFIPRVTQTWSRGAGGRIEAAGSNVSGAPAFDYFIDGQPLATSFDNRDRHLKCQTAGGTWTYAYDSSGQLSSATRSGTSPVTFSYGFDGVGRRSDKGAGNTSDLLNRTVAWNNSQAKTLRIDADPAAQVSVNGTAITGFTGSYTLSLASPGPQGGWVPWTTLAVLPGQGEGAGSTPLNPLASPDAKAQKSGATWIPPVNETFHYDAAGNRLDSAQWEYGWDAKDQLVRARTKDWQTAPQGWDLRFAYDSEGRRFRKEVTRYAAGAVVEQKTVTYVWDGWDIVYERQQLSSGLTILERKYLWGEGLTGSGREMNPGGLLLIRETKGDSSVDLIPLYDGTGHVVALSSIKNDGTAELQASYAYGPFGEPLGATGPRAAGNPWRYATKYLDEETGLYYFGHRYYDPVTGQWLSREPLGEGESVNPYSYCHNDPINRVDVLGFEEIGIDGKSYYIPKELLATAWEDYDKNAPLGDRRADLAEAGLLASPNEIYSPYDIDEFIVISGNFRLNRYVASVRKAYAENKAGWDADGLIDFPKSDWIKRYWETEVSPEAMLVIAEEEEIRHEKNEFVRRLLSDDIAVSNAAHQEMFSAQVHETLDMAGNLPLVADAANIANAVMYAAEDEPEQAQMCFLSAYYSLIFVYPVSSGGLKRLGFQDHHILSPKNSFTDSHELYALAGGFDLESRANKMWLPISRRLHPTRSIHWGRHYRSYSLRLAAEMDKMVIKGAAKSWTQDQYKQALRSIIREERKKLKLGVRVLNSSMGKY